jgi:hypothetical protein
MMRLVSVTPAHIMIQTIIIRNDTLTRAVQDSLRHVNTGGVIATEYAPFAMIRNGSMASGYNVTAQWRLGPSPGALSLDVATSAVAMHLYIEL